MNPELAIDALDDLDLAAAAQVAAGACRIRLTPAMQERIIRGRERFERYLARQGHDV